jgi:DNA adenine methylase
MQQTIPPIIKWTGTKRFVAKEIVSYFPREIDTYYENFIGSGSIVANLIQSDIKCNHIVCSDLNSDLIGIWQLVKNNPNYLLDYYTTKWSELQKQSNIELRKKYYYQQRDLYNDEKLPEQFFFLTRTSYNGLVRYNSDGNFNAPFHFGRPGIHPKKLHNVLYFWHNLIQNVEFRCCDYRDIKPNVDDFVFLDPPYFNVSSPIYNGKINEQSLISYLEHVTCRYGITLDGKNTKDDRTYHLPKELFVRHIYLKMGKSSLRRLKGSTNSVEESLYLNYGE